MIDLHIHTNASDGVHSPADTVQIAAESGMDTIAITDHDTMAGVPEAVNAANAFNMVVIPGVEFSAACEDNRSGSGYDGELHILAYNIDAANETIRKHFEWLIGARRRKVALFVERLNGIGVDIGAEDIPPPAGEIIGRVSVARALVNKKYASNIREAFSQYLVPGCPAYVPGERAEWPDVLRMIQEAGGVSSLAHPIHLGLDEPRFERLITDMAEHGLNGIEAFYPAHTRHQKHYYHTLTQKLGLIATGGSDFHGLSVRHVPIGQDLADYQTEMRTAVQRILNFSQEKPQ